MSCGISVYLSVRPVAPSGCAVANATATSLAVSCRRWGFDGGLPQTLVLEAVDARTGVAVANVSLVDVDSRAWRARGGSRRQVS